MESKKNVFVWGTFDIIHDGHLKFLEKAATYGHLYAILPPDSVIKPVKNTYNEENRRRENLLATGLVKKVFINSLPDNMSCFNSIQPDVFVFGYDQKTEWTDKMIDYLEKRGWGCKYVWLEKYGETHSSDLRRALSFKEIENFHGSKI